MSASALSRTGTAPAAPVDLVDQLAGIAPGSPLEELRSRRPVARFHTQESYEALFGASAGGAVTLPERIAVAAFVTVLHGQGPLARHFQDRLGALDPALSLAIRREIAAAAATGPFGRYPAGPLSAEDTAGVVYRADQAARTALGPKLAAALEHAHLLVFRPREASSAALQALLDAGWTTDAVVTLSQIVAFLSFQIRVVAGLAVLAAHPATQEDRP